MARAGGGNTWKIWAGSPCGGRSAPAHSTVYEADDGGERCALRVFNEDAVARPPPTGLVDALRGLTRLEHPCIVRVLEAGEVQGRVYAAMELMSCPTLAEKLQEEGHLEEKQAALFVRQAAQALDKARDMGYSHGDLRPANLFVLSEEKSSSATSASRTSSATGKPSGLQAAAHLGEELVSAEGLLRAKGRAGGAEKLAEDFAALGLLMMRMLGVEPPRGRRPTAGRLLRTLLHGPLRSWAGRTGSEPPHGGDSAPAALPRGLRQPG